MRVAAVFPLVLAASAPAQPLRSLKGVAVPEPSELSNFVRDRSALIALGKAFFWDMQAASDGRTACATCHFHAGADHRRQNQIADPDHPFPVNLQLDIVHFPLRLLADPGNRNSDVLRDTSLRIGSAGVFRRMLIDVVPGLADELGWDGLDHPEFMSGDLEVRRVTKRNSPSVVNAVFYISNFWDGRANRMFNGFNPSGDVPDAPRAMVSRNGVLEAAAVRLDRASLASQAVGPALDSTEMSYEGRSWAKMARKLFSLPPLALQRVAPDDSVLGPMARVDGPGLQDPFTYLSMIQTAFRSPYWDSTQLVDAAGQVLADRFGDPQTTSEFTQAEYNFPIFWGLALLAYQSTLVSDDTPFDRFMDGDTAALTSQEQDGLQLFQNAGRCNTCHGGAEFSAATFSGASGGRSNRAFQRTGVRSAVDDAGSGNGAFKSVGLRNIELTGPYFHNGGQATLEQVVDFYVRGADFTPTQTFGRSTPLRLNELRWSRL